MAKLKLKKIEHLQLAAFLENRPPKDFPKTSELRKVVRAAEEIQKGLDGFYTNFMELQLKVETLKLPFTEKAFQLIRENQDILEQNGNQWVLKDEKNFSAAQKKQKVKYLKELAEIEEEANKNAELKAANEAFLEFQKANNIEEFEIELNNPEYVATIKRELEEYGTKHDWMNRKTLINLSEAVEQL